MWKTKISKWTSTARRTNTHIVNLCHYHIYNGVKSINNQSKKTKQTLTTNKILRNNLKTNETNVKKILNPLGQKQGQFFTLYLSLF
jgi:hypothetical protein